MTTQHHAEQSTAEQGTAEQPNPQQPSGMPHHRYVPFVPIRLTDRTWPDRTIDEGPALVRGRPA